RQGSSPSGLDSNLGEFHGELGRVDLFKLAASRALSRTRRCGRHHDRIEAPSWSMLENARSPFLSRETGFRLILRAVFSARNSCRSIGGLGARTGKKLK